MDSITRSQIEKLVGPISGDVDIEHDASGMVLLDIAKHALQLSHRGIFAGHLDLPAEVVDRARQLAADLRQAVSQ